MDCKTARQLFDYARPGLSELDADETEALQEHLNECPVCRSLADGEWQLDEHFGRAVRAVAVPTDLRKKLVHWLRRDRRAWYRRCVWAPSTAAAALLLTVGLGWAAWERINAHESDEIAYLPSVSSLLDVENQFRRNHGITVAAPPQFSYVDTPELSIDEYLGKQAPCLRFTHGGHEALVYVLTDDQFDIAATPEPREGYSAKLLRHPTKQHVAYVVYYTGGQLERFFENKGEHTA